VQIQIEERLAILKQVEQVATLAGFRGAIDNDGAHFIMGFETTQGRSQQVWVRPTGKTPEGKAIVTMFSPARVIPKSMFSGISKEDAVELLKLNENTFFARFGIWDNPKESMIVASSDLLLDTMDPDELRAHAFYVSFAADGYEAKHGGGKDQY
jgi:hypothetical protein